MGTRYILNMNVLDHTSSFWITAFNEAAEKLLGVTANRLMELKVSLAGRIAVGSDADISPEYW
jgi:hypothetical protein